MSQAFSKALPLTLTTTTTKPKTSTNNDYKLNLGILKATDLEEIMEIQEHWFLILKWKVFINVNLNHKLNWSNSLSIYRKLNYSFIGLDPNHELNVKVVGPCGVLRFEYFFRLNRNASFFLTVWTCVLITSSDWIGLTAYSP